MNAKRIETTRAARPLAEQRLAYKWILMLFRCWKNRKPYDEGKYTEARRRHGSALVKHFA